MMNEIKPIETYYNGYRFRSRLEARWAVFFDTLGVKYEYEPEGFDLGNGVYYLPDFYLPEVNGGTWIEVKGHMTEEDRRKVELFQNAVSPAFEGEKNDIPGTMLIAVGNIPSENDLNDIWGWYMDMDMENWTYFSPGWDNWYWPCVCEECGKVGFEYEGRSDRICNHRPGYDKGRNPNHPRIIEAYRKARQARFEHGERP